MSWMEDKLEIQLETLNKYNTKFCSTDGFVGNGVYDRRKIIRHLTKNTILNMFRKSIRYYLFRERF